MSSVALVHTDPQLTEQYQRYKSRHKVKAPDTVSTYSMDYMVMRLFDGGPFPPHHVRTAGTLRGTLTDRFCKLVSAFSARPASDNSTIERP
jgi:hypothetical protein